MTESMLPLLEKAGPDARVITVSSGGMYAAPLTTDLQVTASVNFLTASVKLLMLIYRPHNCFNAV